MRLFVAVVEPPVHPHQLIQSVLTGDRSEIGQRVARLVVTLLENEQARRRLVGLLRAAATEPEAARMVRDLVTREVWDPLAEGLGIEDATLRVNLVASQIVGLVMVRCVLEVEPLASLSPAELVGAMAPALQRYLLEPLS